MILATYHETGRSWSKTDARASRDSAAFSVREPRVEPDWAVTFFVRPVCYYVVRLVGIVGQSVLSIECLKPKTRSGGASKSLALLFTLSMKPQDGLFPKPSLCKSMQLYLMLLE